MSGLTTDTFFEGRLKVQQTRAGYRFSIDAVLVAHHVTPRPGDTILDLGTGCGIIALILAYRHPDVTLYGVEVQAPLAELARVNAKANHLAGRITTLQKDLRDLTPEALGRRIDWVVSNPPFHKANSGRMNPHAQRAIARHEIMTTLQDVVATAGRMLSIGGRFATICAVERLTGMLVYMRQAQLEPKRMRMVHSVKGREAKLFLIEGVKGGRPGLTVGPTLYIYNDAGLYTDEVARMMK